MVDYTINKITENITKYRYSELRNRAAQNGVTLRVTDWKTFKEFFFRVTFSIFYNVKFDFELVTSKLLT